VDTVAGSIRHQPIGAKLEVTTSGWLGEARVIGIKSGASTPNNKVGETIARISELVGVGQELRALTA
jgi:4-hydroxy-3-methylbut-2-enyl diphosphate reductase IspH